MNILAIDDEMLSLGILTDIVAKVFPEDKIYPFTSPVDAIDFAKEQECSVAFLDIHMRDMNGIDSAKALQEVNSEMKIVFVSGDQTVDAETSSVRNSTFICKPVTAAAIENSMERLLA